MEFLNEKQQIANQIADTLYLVADLYRSGKCNHLDMKRLNNIKNGAAILLNVDVDYEDAQALSGKTLSSITSAISRNSIERPRKRSVISIESLINLFPSVIRNMKKR